MNRSLLRLLLLILCYDVTILGKVRNSIEARDVERLHHSMRIKEPSSEDNEGEDSTSSQKRQVLLFKVRILGNELRITEFCDVNCKSCLEDGTCTQCSEGFYLVVGNLGLCWNEVIKEGNYFLNGQLKYERCFVSCGSCIEKGDVSNNKCKSCLKDERGSYYRVIDLEEQCWDESMKKDNYYLNQSNEQYEHCFASCKTCLGFGNENEMKCEACLNKKEYFEVIDKPNTCWNKDRKEDTYFFDFSSSLFKKCYYRCKTCLISGLDSIMNCQTCLIEENYYPIEGNYFGFCYNYENFTPESGYYLNTETLQFERCYLACGSCKSKGDQNNMKCDTCFSSYFKVKDNEGICWNQTTKPKNYFFSILENIYIKCFESCEECSSLGDKENTQCLSCVEYYFPSNHDSTLCWNEDIKPINYYLNKGVYYKCHSSCKKCLQGGNSIETNCLECNLNYYPKVKDLATCWNETTHPSNYYFNESKEYEKCHISCFSCFSRMIKAKTNCLICDNAHSYYPKEAELSQCLNEDTKPQNYYLDTTTPSFIYRKCFESCGSCSRKGNVTEHDCNSCLIQFFPLRANPSNCYSSWTRKPNYTFYEGYYEYCYKDCAECYTIGSIEEMNCHLCLEGFHPLRNKTSQCYNEDTKPLKTYYNRDIRRYDYCYDSCNTCQSYGDKLNSQCQTCIENFYPFKDLQSQCIDKEMHQSKYPNYVFDKIDQMFERCFISCAFCSETGGNELIHKCSLCAGGYFPYKLQPTQCFNEAIRPHNYFFNQAEKLYEKCFPSCYACLRKGDEVDNQCESCDNASGYYALYNKPKYCIHISQKESNHFLDTKTNTIYPCYDSCAKCEDLGNPLDTKCLKCREGFSSMKLNLKQCFNSETKPANLFLNKDNQYEACFNSCGSCFEKGDELDNKCNSCAYGYYPLYEKHSNCRNELTKPVDYELNSKGEYEDCKTNPLCHITCNSLKERWYVNSDYKVVCINGLCCNDQYPFYYSQTNQCVQQCPDGTITDSLTNSCIQCNKGARPFLYKSTCYEKCPDGTLLNQLGTICLDCPIETPNYFNGKCLKDCPPNTNPQGIICNPCKGYYNSLNQCVEQCDPGYDYNNEHRCIPKKVIDPSIKIEHNPISYDNEILDYYKNQTLDNSASEVLGKVLDLVIGKDGVSDKINLIILFAEMVKATMSSRIDPEEISRIYSESIDLFCAILKNDVVNFPSITHNEIILILLGQYYLLINHHYITQIKLDQIKETQAVLLNTLRDYLNRLNNQTETYQSQKAEIINLYAITLSQMSNTQYLYSSNDKDYNTRLFKYLHHRMRAMFITDSCRVLMRDVIELYVKFTLEVTSPLYSSQTIEHLAFLNMPLEYLSHIGNSSIQLIPNCLEDQMIVSSMREMKVTIQVCLPKVALNEAFPNGGYISLIQYQSQYPLYNINVTEVNSSFISLNMYSLSFIKEPIKTLNQSMKIYINTSSSDYLHCLFYDETNKSFSTEGCSSNLLNETVVVCTCNHLGDIGLSKVNPNEALSKDNFLYSSFRIINSMSQFEQLDALNAIVFYCFFGSLLLFILCLIPAIMWDMKTYDDDLLVGVIKESKFSDEVTIFRGMLTIKAFILQNPLELSKQESYTMKKSIDSALTQKHLDEEEIEESISTYKSSKENTSSSRRAMIVHQSPLLFWNITKLFFKYEYRPLLLFSQTKTKTIKSHLVTLLYFRLIIFYTLSAMVSSCRSLKESWFSFSTCDYIFVFVFIIPINIGYTLFEEVLSRAAVALNKEVLFNRFRTAGRYWNIIVYLIFIGLFIFGLMNTAWVSLELINQELTSMMYIDFLLIVLVDIFIYKVLLLMMKTVIYYLLVKYIHIHQANEFIRLLLKGFSLFPWFFEIRWTQF